MDLCCTETMINDAENELLYEYQSVDGKSQSTSTSAGGSSGSTGSQQQQQPQQSGIAKLYSSASPDPTFLKMRCLTNLLKSQTRYTTSTDYFNKVQKTLTPQMRKIVAEWVIEVSCKIQVIFERVNGVICVREEVEVVVSELITQVLRANSVQQFVDCRGLLESS